MMRFVAGIAVVVVIAAIVARARGRSEPDVADHTPDRHADPQPAAVNTDVTVPSAADEEPPATP